MLDLKNKTFGTMPDDKLILRPIDSRTIRMYDIKFIEKRNERDEIVELYRQRGNIKIKIGDSVHYKNNPYKVNVIARGMSNGVLSCYDLKSAVQNMSSVFITPLLGYSQSELRWGLNFINTFLATPEHPRCIALLYRFDSDKSFLKFESWVKEIPEFIRATDTDRYHVLFVFGVPKEATSAYDCICQGRYSDVCDLWKLQILDFHKFKRDGTTGQILYKDRKLRDKLESELGVPLNDSELYSIPDLRYEKFDPEYYKVKLPYEKRNERQDTGVFSSFSLGEVTPSTGDDGDGSST